MPEIVLRCIKQYTKFEVSSFTNYEDMSGAKFTIQNRCRERHDTIRYDRTVTADSQTGSRHETERDDGNLRRSTYRLLRGSRPQ